MGSGPGLEGAAGARFGAALALSVTLATGGFMVLMPVVLLLVHPIHLAGAGAFASVINQQSQPAKTALYLSAFALVLPLALIGASRLADRIAGTPNASALDGLTAALGGALIVMLILVKLSASLPWGDGLGTLLAGACAWWAFSATALARASAERPWRALGRLTRSADALATVAGALLLGLLLCVTSLRSLSGLAIALGAVVGVSVLVAYPRIRLPRIDRGPGRLLDVVAVLVLLLAVPDVVVFHASGGLPNIYLPPGVIQFQHDWILGPTNQLLAGGAVLVDVPSSQYGVGLMYFLAAWFHLVSIGYGTFGLLDGLLTALVYIAAYSVLRIAGVGRVMATGAIAFAVAVLLYNLPYSVGALPEQGPLRFGLPMAVILAQLAENRWPQNARAARAAALVTLAVSSIWALEAFAYTAFTLAALWALEAWRLGARMRARWLAQRALSAAGVVLCAHLLLAGATLVGTGQLPDWTQYLGYLRGLLLGGHEGTVTYGFSDWSPALVVGAGLLASAAGVVLLVWRSPALVAGRRTLLVGLTGSTAYGIASFSYIDNRSSTYLLLYTSLPVLVAAVLWLDLLLGAGDRARPRVRLGGLALALGVALLMLAAAWPSIGPHLSRTALAHAYPGGGLGGALRRLAHPPPIDPRAPEGERLLKGYLPGPRALVLLPPTPDLGIEIELRARRASQLFIGDPTQDVFVPATWMPKITQEISRLRSGTRALVDEAALGDVRSLRNRSGDYVLRHPLPGRNAQLDWTLRQLDRRFRLIPIHAGPDGFLVVELQSRHPTLGATRRNSEIASGR